MSFIINIRRAIPAEHALLSDISLRSKRIWPYPEEYFAIWREELTISPEYIAGNLVYLAEQENRVTGYYAIVHNPQDRQVGEVFVEKGYWLEHLFILPEYIYHGIGRELLSHAIDECRKLSCRRLVIFVDPFARGFYEKMGAHFLYDSPSSIRGRKIPVFGITIPEN
jgi:maltose O-acetyltransferase